jgi:2-dehydro-3-deoxyphosphogluconate aldolase/(4S)-4-hydroxy-2-oxoglutarate aldolase
VKFCPTGGISLETAPDWLAAEPVLCVGGSWVVGKGVPNVAAITKAAAQAAALAS